MDTSGGEQERQRELKSGWGGGGILGRVVGQLGVGDSAGWELMEQVARLEDRAVAWDLEY